MADFATEFITKLNGKLTPEQMKVVLNWRSFRTITILKRSAGM